ncbi:MAG: hypothetical protein ACM359_17040 [Bacillota bacterium]
MTAAFIIDVGSPAFRDYLYVTEDEQNRWGHRRIPLRLIDAHGHTYDQKALEKMGISVKDQVIVRGTMKFSHYKSPDGKEWIVGPPPLPFSGRDNIQVLVLEVSKVRPALPK